MLLLQSWISWLRILSDTEQIYYHFSPRNLLIFFYFLNFFNCHTVATINLSRLSDSWRILTFVLKWGFFFVSINTYFSAAARQILSFCGGERTAFTEILLMQSRQQVSGQTKSPVFDTEQIIVTLSLLFTRAGVRFLYFIISLVCAQGHLLSILPGDSSSNSSREGNDVREEVLHHDGFQILGLIILLLQVATQQKKPQHNNTQNQRENLLEILWALKQQFGGTIFC